MKVAVVVFPGSNCDHDAIHLYGTVLGAKAYEVWHRETDLKKPDLVVIPGGFAFGDYLRTGALAKVSPIMKEVAAFAGKGGPVVGICNGFQILCEVGLLPGVLLQNIQMKFLSQFIHMKVERTDTPFSKGLTVGDVITCPMAHFEGNYFAAEETIAELEGEGRVVFRYCSVGGLVDPSDLNTNPNGSRNAIAGICNKSRNVVGFMPHPERAAEPIVAGIASGEGVSIFQSSVS